MSSFRDRLRAAARPGRPADDAALELLAPTVVVGEAGDLVDAAGSPPPPGGPARAPSLRAERAQLRRGQAEAATDLAGLALEMARRDRFNHDLLERRARDAVALERRIAELDDVLAGTGGEWPADAQQEEAAHAPTARHCTRCQAEQAEDANFCAYCGAPRGAGR